MSTILIDRRTAALLGELAAEPAGSPATTTAAAVRVRGSSPARRVGPAGRAAGGDSRLAHRLRCSEAAVRGTAGRARSRRPVAPPIRVRPAPAARPALHLTRRGRLVALLLLLVVLTVAFSMGRVTSTALGSPAGPGPEVVVQRGDTLWSIAERIRPDADPRSVAADLMALNGLASPSLQIGQQLRLP